MMLGKSTVDKMMGGKLYAAKIQYGANVFESVFCAPSAYVACCRANCLGLAVSPDAHVWLREWSDTGWTLYQEVTP